MNFQMEKHSQQVLGGDVKADVAHYGHFLSCVKGGGNKWTTGAISRAKLQSNQHHP